MRHAHDDFQNRRFAASVFADEQIEFRVERNGGIFEFSKIFEPDFINSHGDTLSSMENLSLTQYNGYCAKNKESPADPIRTY